MLFGEFLLSKGVIKQNELLEALVIQLSKTPSHQEIVAKKALISTPDFLKALKIQHETGRDFKTVCANLNIWNSNISRAIEDEIIASRPPVGKILLDLKKITSEQLKEFLDQYKKTYSNSRQKNQAPEPIQAEHSEHPFAVAFSSKVEDFISKLLSKNIGTSADFSVLHDVFGAISQVASSSNLNCGSYLCFSCSMLAEKLAVQQEDSYKKNAIETLKAVLILLKDIRKSVAVKQDESDFVGNSENSRRFGEISMQLEKLLT